MKRKNTVNVLLLEGMKTLKKSQNTCEKYTKTKINESLKTSAKGKRNVLTLLEIKQIGGKNNIRLYLQ